MFKEQYGPWALIVGGSEGIGAAFARKLAARGINLVLVARKPKVLASVSEEIQLEAGVKVRTAVLDVVAPDALQRIISLTDDLSIGCLVYNAGAFHGAGDFADSSLEEAMAVVKLNVHGPLILAHQLGLRMRERRRGGIILVGSIAGLAGRPKTAVYAAAKAFGHTLAEGLWREMQPYNVQVLGLIPGLTRTPALERDYDVSKLQFPLAEPDMVAEEGLLHLNAGPIRVVSGNEEFANKLRTIPRPEAVALLSN